MRNLRSFGGEYKMERDAVDILLTGVGGQGIITLAKIIGSVANSYGVRVLMAETHGMSQRGGSVVVHVRLGDVYYPLIPKGGADVILGLELIETFRYITYASKETLIITNDRMIRPGLPNVKMPDKNALMEFAENNGFNIVYINGSELADKAGSSISLNMVMLGALVASNTFPFKVSLNDFVDVISGMPLSQVNLKAFRYGYSKFKELVSGAID